MVEGMTCDAEASRQLDDSMQQAEIEVKTHTHEQAQIARRAYRNDGKGRHRAGLNFGDCFAYAPALQRRGLSIHRCSGV